MYYSKSIKKVNITYRIVTTLLILSVYLFACNLSVNAQELLEISAEGYRAKGFEEQQNTNYEMALTYYAKAISLGLNTASIYNDIGVIYEQLGVFKKAEENYLKAIDIDPSYLPPYTNLAYFYENQGDKKQAIYFFQERFKRAEDGDPWKERVRDELCRLDPQLKEQFFQYEVEKLNEQIIRKAHEEFYLTVMRSEKHLQNSQRYYEQNNFIDALAEINRALAITPDNPKILKMQEVTLLRKKAEDIKEKADKVIELINADDLASAEKEFQQILTANPNEAIQKPE